MVTQVSGANQWLTLNGVTVRFGPREENLTANAVENKRNQFVVTAQAPADLELLIDDETLETEVYGRWLWRARDYAGVYTLTVRTSEGITARTQIRVVPSKLSQERYEAMLEDISRIASDLVFALHAPSREYATLKRGLNSPAVSDYRRLQVFMRNLEDVLTSISQSPHRRLGTSNEVRSLHELAGYVGDVRPVPGESEYIGFGMGSRQYGPLVPRYWVTERSEPTYNVSENRLIKQFLWGQLLPRIQEIRRRAEIELGRRQQELQRKRQYGWEDDETPKISQLESILVDCERLGRQVATLGSMTFLRHVEWPSGLVRPTQVFQKHPHYGRFYRLYLHFQSKLRYTSNVENYVAQVATRKVAELYEIWTVFMTTTIVLDMLKKAEYAVVSGHGFYKLVDDQLQVEIDRNASIELRRGKQTVLIRYEPLYPSVHATGWGLVAAARSQLTPDLAIEVWEGDEARSVIVFDAKYRINRVGGRESFLDEDINKMDTYFKRIQWKSRNPRVRPREIVSSAYILYPGSDIEHDRAYPEVGALPLTPRMKQPRVTLAALVDILRYAEIL